eukprot:scaffold3554_cov242-Prasinococcus_capsulatus_cf.AAC.1
MRHPSAADLVRSIKGFISSFSTSSAGPSSLEEADEDGVKVQSFMENMENTFRSHSLWRNATEEELDAACEVRSRTPMLSPTSALRGHC